MKRNQWMGVGVSVVAAAALGGLGGFLTAGGRLGGAGSDDGPVVARIGERKLLASEVKARIAEYGPLASARLSTVEGKRELVDELVRTELWAQAGRAKGYDADPQFRRRVSEALAEAFLQRELEPKKSAIEVTEAELRARFEATRGQLSSPERVRIADVFLSAPEEPAARREARRAEAEKLLAEAKKALAKDFHAFAPLARQRSEDPESRPNGGELPALTEQELSIRAGPEVAHAAFAMARPSELHDGVIATAAGFHVFRLLEREPAKAPTFEAMREVLRSKLRAEKEQALYETLLAQVRGEIPVEVDTAVLQSL